MDANQIKQTIGQIEKSIETIEPQLSDEEYKVFNTIQGWRIEKC